MNIKKMSGSLAVAVSLLALNGAALADCSDTITEIELKADEVRCDAPNDNPIWLYKGTKGDGCVVHEKLAKKLNEERTEEPPRINKNKTNIAGGAANDLRNGYYDNAQQKLQEFIDVMMSAAHAREGQQYREDALIEWAYQIKVDAEACM